MLVSSVMAEEIVMMVLTRDQKTVLFAIQLPNFVNRSVEDLRLTNTTRYTGNVMGRMIVAIDSMSSIVETTHEVWTPNADLHITVVVREVTNTSQSPTGVMEQLIAREEKMNVIVQHRRSFILG